MYKSFLVALVLSAAVLTATSPVVAEEEAAAGAVAEQSIAPEAADAAGHDHSGTCGSGGSCCSACQLKQKYSKSAAEGDEGGCPCKKAKMARERAAREQAAAKSAAAPVD